jgi:hypothetical protein
VVLAAIASLTKEIKDLSVKTVTKDDLGNFQADMTREMASKIAESVSPLQTKIDEMDSRFAAFEKQALHNHKSLVDRVAKVESTGSSSSGPSLPKEAQSIINSLDPAFRRVSLLGFAASASAEKRLEDINKFVDENFANFKPATPGNIYKGPRDKRTLTPNSYLEFPNNDRATDFLKNFPRGSMVKVGGQDVAIKPAITKINSQRNYSIRKAEEILKADPANQGKNIESILKDRVVQVAGHIAFRQDKNELGGTFVGPYSHLSLP